VSISVLIPHWPRAENAELLQRCVASFVTAGADQVLVVCGGPLPDGGSSVGRNINRGLEVLWRASDYIIVTNDDIVWQEGSLAALCKERTVCSPGDRPFWGPCFCLPASAAYDIGYFDDRFDGYYEDEDYVLRLRIAGYDLIGVPECVVDHHHGGGNTIGALDAPGLMAKNRARYVDKWGPDADGVWQTRAGFEAWYAQWPGRPGTV